MKPFFKTVFDKLKRFIDSIESTNIGFGWWMVTFACIIAIRNFLEGVLECDKTIGFVDQPYSSIIRFFGHYSLFYISQALILAIILRLLTKERIEKVTKTVIVFWTITCCVPIFDFFISGGKGANIIYFHTINEVWRFFIYCANPWVDFSQNASPGIRVEFVTVTILAIIYVYIKTQNWIKSISGAIIFYLTFVFYAGGFFAIITHLWNSVFPHLPPANMPTPFEKMFFTPSLLLVLDEKPGLIFLLVIVVALFTWFLLYDRKKCAAFLHNIRLTRCVHYCGLVVGGIILGYLVEGKNLPGVFGNPLDYLACVSVSLALFFGIQSLIVVNDIVDVESDRISNQDRPLVQGAIPLAEYKIIGIVCFFLMVYFSINVSHVSLMILLFFMALYIVYSIPPFRLKRVFPLNMMVIGINSLVAMLLGYSLLGGAKTVEKFPKEFMILIPLVFFLAANIITIKDIKADKQDGVITLPVLFGEKYGKLVIAGLVLLSYLIVPLGLNMPQLWVVSILFGILAVLLVLEKAWNENMFFINYFICLVIMFSSLLISGKYN
ncbi:MAG: UbiA family prenyltransferase [Planctomycetes bacterium]|nr:UbiA family prenyltransferase [Planctomycetota bacterium]